MVKERVTRGLAVVDTDIRVIVNMPLFQEYVNSGDPVLKTKLEHYFLNFSNETKRYDQMRYLDLNGHEVFRVNYNDGYPDIVPANLLQNKKDRYYFINTVKLNQNEIFISPLDLNMEFGKLEVPFKPVIRYGTPIFDKNKHKKGILLVNYLGSKLLKIFREEKQNSHPTMLLNRDGYWLSGLNPEDEWGFMLGNNNRTFEHDFPQEWKILSNAEQGALVTEDGLFVFTTAYHLSNWHKVQLNPAMEDNYYWKIVSFIPNDALLVNTIYNQPLGKILLGIIYLLLALASFYVARVIINRRQVTMALHDSSARVLSILNAVSEGIHGVDLNGNIMIENPASIRMLGGKKKKLLANLHIK
ncbi:cache domain-containing protein [Colwellia sp. MSW7]|uniref:Cache domain-containing protein n=1 Tax=Colwellia maritima TaxID=2912588 RepID=A0ABS9X2T5_9GAMM|nr:cache domain-containing protein [Colwellia maritima]MCI2284555.1 cache domain-containing protein [Colwellia maritima]